MKADSDKFVLPANNRLEGQICSEPAIYVVRPEKLKKFQSPFFVTSLNHTITRNINVLLNAGSTVENNRQSMVR